MCKDAQLEMKICDSNACLKHLNAISDAEVCLLKVSGDGCGGGGVSL